MWDVPIPNAITQFICGKTGAFTVQMVERPAMVISQFLEATKAKSDADDIALHRSNETEAELYSQYERKFWKSLSVNCEPPFYGADIPGSLFGDLPASSWNLNRLDTLLQLTAKNIPGITTSMLYIGMWRAMFAWHIEDMNLHSINYVHVGAPKCW
jgi:jumonji domain-containing protein 2